MLLVLHRNYFPNGTQGILKFNSKTICYTIELPWLKNQCRVSCIPEGEYILQKRFSKRFNKHIYIKNVPGRNLILFHPANDAKKELQGCIAPVTNHIGIGKGNYSRNALKKLTDLVFPLLDKNTQVKLKIISTNSDLELEV
ncbi:DUF5675 family protein [Lutibacter aestuarii]|uniref:DUF5675 family protein n=1 Tax=Lutibacter aestuarii TaxID=861111 RepID=A0ABW2ZC71_9FLAO